MGQQFDLICIGTGSAASTVASRCRAAGWTVAVIDKRPFGGTCALRGCDPKKVLVGAADVVDWVRRIKGKGVADEGARIDWPELMRFKRTFTEPTPRARENSFRGQGIATFSGSAQFTGPTSLRVGSDFLDARHIVIAVGMKPAPLGIAGENLITDLAENVGIVHNRRKEIDRVDDGKIRPEAKYARVIGSFSSDDDVGVIKLGKAVQHVHQVGRAELSRS